MTAVTWISWASVATVLAAYATGNGKWFDYANAILFWPVALPAVIAGAYSSAAISISFGLIACVRLARGALRKRRVKRVDGVIREFYAPVIAKELHGRHGLWPYVTGKQ